MGDRTYCSLTLSGVLLDMLEYKTLLQALKDADVDQLPPTPDGLDKGKPVAQFSFYEVNYHEMDGALSDLLDRYFLSYVWKWDNGDDYNEGVLIKDAVADVTYEETTSDGDFFLTLRDLDKPEIVANLRAAEAARKAIFQGDLVIAGSAHRVLELLGDPDTLQRWQDARVDEDDL
jgi:hypothetical protein